MRPRCAFTLVELLVVVAIIALLMALMVPAVLSARETGRRLSCLNNLHQFGFGMLQYADTHNGEFPFTYHAGNTQSWIVTVSPYVENVNDMRLCPDDPMGEQRVQADAGGISGTSYVINEYVAYQTTDGFSVQNMKQMASTHNLIVLFEGADNGRTALDDHVHTSTWYSPVQIARGTLWNTITAEINPIQHVDCANYLYADGHADTISLDTFQNWVQQDIASGTNFARPERN